MERKERILQAALDLLKTEKLEALTVRKIAARAGVNAALVNYHFGSKDRLLNAAVRRLTDSFRGTFAVLEDEALPPRERLKRFLLQYVRLVQQYPFIVERLMADDPFLFDTRIEYASFLKTIGMKHVQRTVRDICGERDPAKLAIMVSHLLGAAFLPVLIEPLYRQVTGGALPDAGERIELLLDRYFPPEASNDPFSP